MNSGSTRMKRVTDPLDDNAKARIFGRNKIGSDYVSSGSEHSSQPDDDVTSSSLSELFLGFSVGDASEPPAEGGDSDSDGCHRSMCDSISASVDLIGRIVEDERDAFRKVLRIHVWRAAEIFSCLRSNKQMMRRNAMAYLRNCGYNAAICKAKWESSGGLTAGSYEFIDVVRADSPVRYFVDLDFAAEFEIARPTSLYERLLRKLPRVFVGTGEDLKQILKVVSDAARKSLKSCGLILPPWRKHRFVQNKWLGPYRRTTNVFPESFSSPSAAKHSYGVKCRAVGFDATTNGGRLLLPSAARTR
ncbi:hypothetical protein C2S52_016798 [Perilla frutescens var. hirtella]|nr:hypothetical protein C2S52_016798 [Perilla frutescens var. hirtella]